MTLDPAGTQLPATLWLLAVVLAWPAGNPTAAAVLLAAQSVGYLIAAAVQLLNLRTPPLRSCAAPTASARSGKNLPPAGTAVDPGR
jgi:hypothetical protein